MTLQSFLDGNRSAVGERRTTMTLTAHSRRLTRLLAVSSVAIVLSSCGSDAPPAADTSPPVIDVVGGANAGRAASADVMVASGADEMSKMMAPMVFEYTGPDIDLTGPMPAYRLVPTPVADEAVNRLAQAFAVDGELTKLPAEQGGGTTVGPSDGSGPSVTVMNDALQTWWFADPVASMSATCVTVPVDPASTDASGDAAVSTECAEPEPPANVPDAATGEQIARDLLESIGMDPAAYEFDTYADEWGVSITGYLTVDGVRSPISVSVGIGDEGRVTWAGGSLAQPERVADYPRVGVAAAVERLNTQSAGWSAFGPAVVDPAVVDPAVVDPAVVDPAVVEPVPEESTDGAAVSDAPAVEMPIVGEPMTVRLSDPQPALEQIWSRDDVVWLVPAYSFTGDDGGRYTALAIADDYLQPVEPEVVESPPPPVVDSVDVPEVVGLAVDEATKVAEAAGWTVRAVRVDGEELAVTADYVATRLNVAVEAGMVTEVLSVG